MAKPGIVQATDSVHPEVQAYINNLVSALGGQSDDDTALYKLGIDGLEVLRDLKKWLRFYDEKMKRMDVARCLADCNLIGNDLLHIIRLWTMDTSNSMQTKYLARCALACFELIVPLTWSLEREKDTVTVNQWRHLPVLELAQLNYKRDILNYDGTQILSAAVKVALPSVAISLSERSPRDTAIIRLVLYFLRNVAAIDAPPHINYSDYEAFLSRSVTIETFHCQDIFIFFLTLASNMGDDFRTEDVLVMEVLYHLTKRVDAAKIFESAKEIRNTDANELRSLMAREKAMLREHGSKPSTRHSRFGTMIWVKKADGQMATVTGQDALLDPAVQRRRMDSAKTYNAPRRGKRAAKETEPDSSGEVFLATSAKTHLRDFVVEFFESSFNPLFQHTLKSLQRESEHVLKEQHKRQFFKLVAWMLEANRACQSAKMEEFAKTSKKSVADEISSFNLVAAVLTQEMFIFMQRYLMTAWTEKAWADVAACARCFTQILLTVQDMAATGSDDDEEIAENILNRIFYEEDTHDLVAHIATSYKSQGFEYLDASTELVHTYLRILEGYSKQNVDMMVKSKKRLRSKKKKKKKEKESQANSGASETQPHDGDEALDTTRLAAGEGEEGDEGDEEATDDEASAQRVIRERKFDFSRFSARFASQGVVDSFVALTQNYLDLNDVQLKRAHRYFYRVAFKQELDIMLHRLDIIYMFYNIIKGPHPLPRDRASSTFKDWEELVRQIFRKLIHKLKERPILFVELLFSKIPSTVYYLQHGHDKPSTKGPQKPAAELEFKYGLEDRKSQIAIVVTALIDKQQNDHIEWIKRSLESAIAARTAWETTEKSAQDSKSGSTPEMASATALPPVTNSLFGGCRTDTTTPDAATKVSVSMEENASGVVQESELVNPSIDATDEAQQTPKPDPGPKRLAEAFNVKPDTDERKKAMFKNGQLRLLMKLVGIERFETFTDETPDSLYVIHGIHSADQLKESLQYIKEAEFSPPTFDSEKGRGSTAEDQLRRKRASPKGKRRAGRGGNTIFDDDNDDDAGSGLDGFLERDSDDEEDAQFEPGGPTVRKTDEHAKRKRKNRPRQKKDGEEEVDEAELDAKLAERRRKKTEREREKARKIKSEVYVRDSDEDWDIETSKKFFSREEELRNEMQRLIGLALRRDEEKERREEIDGMLAGPGNTKAKDLDALMGDSDDELAKEEEAAGIHAMLDDNDDGGDKVRRQSKSTSRKRARAKSSRKTRGIVSVSNEEDDNEGGENYDSESDIDATRKKKRRARMIGLPINNDDDDDDDGHDTVVADDMAKLSHIVKSLSSDMEMDSANKEAEDSNSREKIDGVLAPTATLPTRARTVRSGFVIDSSDENE